MIHEPSKRSSKRLIPWLAVLALTAATTAGALEDTRFRVPGKALVQGREFPAQLRVLCSRSKNLEVQLAVIFKDSAEAAGSDAFFPFGTFEGPDGKPAPIAVEITTPDGKALKHRLMSAAGWFGVENEYLFSLRPTDGARFLAEGATATSITASIMALKTSLAFSFAKPDEVLGKAAAACK